MGNQILRDERGQNLAFTEALTAAFDFSIYSMMMIHVPAGWNAASIGFQVSNTIDGTFQPLYDEEDTLIEITPVTASRSYPVPARVAAARFVKIWSQTAAVDVNQPGITLDVGLKA